MGTVTLDANVIIAYLNPPDAQHEVALDVLRRNVAPGDAVLIPASVLSEILVGPERNGTVDVVDAFLQGIPVTIVPIDSAIARRAARLRASHAGLRLPDALALATALGRSAKLLTLDQRLQQIAERETGSL